MVMDFVMVRAPKPPGSRASISPPAAVLEMAPANVLHGAVRLQGLTSSPTPDTQVRVAPIAVPSQLLAPTPPRRARACRPIRLSRQAFVKRILLSANGVRGPPAAGRATTG